MRLSPNAIVISLIYNTEVTLANPNNDIKNLLT